MDISPVPDLPVPDYVRALVHDVAAWALAHGRSADRRALAALLAARHEQAHGPLSRWSVEDVRRLLGGELEAWCWVHSIAPPGRAGESLATYLEYLSDRGALEGGSDQPSWLRRAAIAADPDPAGGGDASVVALPARAPRRLRAPGRR